MARLRTRQRKAGLTSLSIVVPTADVQVFSQLAMRRRKQLAVGNLPNLPLPARWVRTRTPVIGTGELLELREALELAAVTLVVRRMNPRIVRSLRLEIAREAVLSSRASSAQLQRLHILLAELSGDHTLQLLAPITLRLTEDRSVFARASMLARAQGVARIRRLHLGIVDALIEQNDALARRRMRRYLTGLREWLL
jgi:DNA-binding FadR family transcriptional regulator